MTTRGKMSCVMERHEKFLVGDIVVVESSKPSGLLGRNFLAEEIREQINHHEIVIRVVIYQRLKV